MGKSDMLDESKIEIRSILISYQKGCYVSEFIHAYKDFIGKPLPYRELGFRNDIEFLYSIPDVVKITPTRSGDYHLLGIADEKSKHIQKMVCKQKPAKLKMPSKYRDPYMSYVPAPRFIEVSKTVNKPKESNLNISVKPKDSNLTISVNSKNSSRTVATVNSSPKDEITSLVKQFKNGILLSEILMEYENMYRKSFSFTNYGFSSLQECIESISECDLVQENNKFIVYDSSNITRNQVPRSITSEVNIQRHGGVPAAASDKSNHRVIAEGNIPNSLKEKLQLIARKIPQGIRASDFPDYFEKITHSSFDLHYYGYNCLADFIDDASDIFIREQAPESKGNYIIYPVEKYSFDSNEHNGVSETSSSIIPSGSYISGPSLIDNIIFNVRTILEANTEGIMLQDFLHIYSINCKHSLRIKDLGFRDLEMFLLSVKDRVPLKFDECNGMKFIHLLKLGDSLPADLNISSDACQLEAIPFDAEFSDFQFSEQTFPPDFDYKKYIPVYVSSVAHPGHLYIQLQMGETENLGKLSDDMDNFYNGSHSNLYLMKNLHIKVGASCIALWPTDQHWYRAKILTIPSMETVQVLYVDYGTRDTIPKSLLRYMKKDYAKLPAQAIKCSLAFLKPSKNAEKWDPKTKQRLLQMCEDIPLMAKIGEMQADGSYPVVLCDTNGDKDIYINDVLHTEGLADLVEVSNDSSIPASPNAGLQPEYHNINPLQALQAQYYLQAFAAVAPSFAQNENYLKLLRQISMFCPNSDPLQQNPNLSFSPGVHSVNMLANPYSIPSLSSVTVAPSFGADAPYSNPSFSKNTPILPPTNPQGQFISYTYLDMYSSPKTCRTSTAENKNNDSEIFEDDDELFQQLCQKVSTKVCHVKRIYLGDGYKIHIIVVDSKPYASSGDISQLIWNNKEADYLSRRLQIKEVDFPTINLSEDGNEECFQQLERLNVKGVQKTTGFKPSILLYPLKVVIKILNLFGHPSISLRTKLTEEITKFDPNDPMWKEFSVPESSECEEDGNFSGVTDDDKIERLCLYDLLAMKEGIKCKRNKMLNNLNDPNNSKCVDELGKLDQLREKVLQRIQEIKEICSLFA